MILRASAALLDVGAVARQLLDHLGRHAPDAFGRRLHDPANRALPVDDDVDKRLPVDCQRHRPPQFRVVEGWRLPVDDHVPRDVSHEHVANRVRQLVLDVLQLRHRDTEIRVLVAGHE